MDWENPNIQPAKDINVNLIKNIMFKAEAFALASLKVY
jgi:hypothetical protein